MQRIDGDGDKDEFVLQGNLLMKLLRKFYAYNEMEKRHILSLNAAFEMYFVDDDVTDVAYVAKRLVLSVSIDRFVHYIVSLCDFDKTEIIRKKVTKKRKTETVWKYTRQ